MSENNPNGGSNGSNGNNESQGAAQSSALGSSDWFGKPEILAHSANTERIVFGQPDRLDEGVRNDDHEG